MSERKPLQDVVQSHRERIMKIRGVTGFGAGLSKSGSGQKCLLVYSTSEAWPEELPHELDGYSVEMIVRTKGFRAL